MDSFSVRYDALAPNLVHGVVQDTETEVDLPVLTVTSTRTPPLAAEPALATNVPCVRNTQYCDPRLDAVWAYAEAQSITDRSTDKVVVVQGQLDTLRYGAVLSAPGLVGVRGMGYSYDGLYYVQSVTHRISRQAYKQVFMLNREGMGSLTTEVSP